MNYQQEITGYFILAQPVAATIVVWYYKAVNVYYQGSCGFTIVFLTVGYLKVCGQVLM